MTSDTPATEPAPNEAYVWIWLPGETDPVVAGRIFRDDGDDAYTFTYGRSYLDRHDAISLYTPELPLRAGNQDPPQGLTLPGALRDGGPDAWGRRVIVNRRLGTKRAAIDIDALDDLTYFLESGSDRIGALDFQRSATRYEPRDAQAATLDDLMGAADMVQQGVPLPPALDRALFHGSSIGGARPKALIDQGGRKLIAKFPSTTDLFNLVKGEYVAMRLAETVGLSVAPVRLIKTSGRDVLLIERFDRVRSNAGWTRRAMVSALTLFGLDEMMGHYASYEDLCGIIRDRFTEPRKTLRELFGRLVLNILTGNTDDHARNHAAFWDGQSLSLTPAYDICPQGRTGNEAGQAMLIMGNDRLSRLATCLRAAPNFLLNETDAAAIIEAQVMTIRDAWPRLREEAELSPIDQAAMWGRQILNPFAFEGLPTRLAHLAPR